MKSLRQVLMLCCIFLLRHGDSFVVSRIPTPVSTRSTVLASRSIDKNPFKPGAVENEKFDSIVIGSGIGGLTTASLLANHGQKVLVLEQHHTAGGACHTFESKGYVFGTGLHYVGDPSNMLGDVLDCVTPKDDHVVWDKMSGKTAFCGPCFHHCIRF